MQTTKTPAETPVITPISASTSTSTNTSTNTPAHTPCFALRVLKRAVCAICFLLVVICMNACLLRIIMPYSSWSMISWDDFVSAGQVQTIITGSSFAERAIDPTILSKQTHKTIYNTSVPYQSLHDSLESIKQAYEEKGIREAIVGVRAETFMPDPNINLKVHSLFSVASYTSRQPVRWFSDVWQSVICNDTILKPASIQYLAKWTYHIDGLLNVPNNIAAITSHQSRVRAATSRYPYWHYFGYGFANYSSHQILTENNMNVAPTTMRDFSDEFLREYEAICAYCHDKGIKLTVVIAPHQAYELASFGSAYPEHMKKLEEIARSYQALYVDSNMVKDPAYRAKPTDFYDSEHVRTTGSTRLTQLLLPLVAQDDYDAACATRAQMFYTYDEWDTMMRTLPGVFLTKVAQKVENGMFTGYITSIASPFSKVEWQVVAKKLTSQEAALHPTLRGARYFSKDANYHVIREWSSNPVVRWTPPQPGTYSLIVRARPTSSDSPDMSYTRFDVTV